VAEIEARPAVQRGRIVNKVWGDEDTQLKERHSAADFAGKRLVTGPPA
jgi:GSH-dependent disulfide-bond oxidoreductase